MTIRQPFKAPFNPFRIKTAEHYQKPEDINFLFAYPPEYDVYKSPNNFIILGSRGCGKTILLKKLSIRAQSLEQDITKLEFCGVYIQRLLQLNNLLQIYRRGFDGAEKFEHYVALKVIYETANQFSQTSISTEAKRNISGIVKNTVGLENFQGDLYNLARHLEEAVESFEQFLTSDPASKMADPKGLKIQNLGALITFLKRLSKAIYPLPRVALLIDDFQDYEELGISLLNNLASHKFLDFLCVKVSTRNLTFEVADLLIEPSRDFEIRCLDGNPNDPKWLDFLRKLANNKLKTEWQLSEEDLETINIDTLFPAIKPQGIHWDEQKSPGQNLAKIVDRDLRPKCFCGFGAIAKVSMMNPFEFFEVCDKAYDLEEKNKGLVTIPPGISLDAQISALLEKGRNYIEVNLISRKAYSEFFLGLRALIVNLAHYLEQKQNPPSFEGMRIALPEDLSVKYVKLLRKAIIHRDFFIPNEQLMPILLSPSPTIEELEINRLICPRYAISWEYTGKVRIEEDILDKFFEKRYAEPMKSKQKPLLEVEEYERMPLFGKQDLWVFEARPHGVDDTKIQGTVNAIRREEAKTTGRALPTQATYYMNEEIARQMFAPRFPDYLGEAIKKSTYVIANITGKFGTGVAYEVGTAFGYKKAVFIFWDSDELERRFNAEEDKKSWHSFIVQHDLKEWTSELKRKGSFKSWYKTHVDGIGKKTSGQVKCPIKSFEQERCPFEAFIRKGINKPYILFQTRNKQAEESVISFLSSRNCYPILRNDVPKEADDICFRCISIQASRFQIIDGSAPTKERKGDPACAIELGFAYALHSEKCLMLYDADKNPEPVVMFAGGRHGWHESTLEKDLKEKLQEFMDKFPEFGGIKK